MSCHQCGKEFEYYPCMHKVKKRRFCSLRCYEDSNVRIKNLGSRFTGRKHKESSIRKCKNTWKTKIHPGWKGDSASYITMPQWVRRHRGTPQKCDHCGYDKSDRKYEWANVSGRYLRDLDDYKRVCLQCHRKHYTNAVRKVSHGHFADRRTQKQAA